LGKFKNVIRNAHVQRFIGRTLGRYVKLVMRTTRFRSDPADYYKVLDDSWPAIVTMWHGQQLLIPAFIRPKDDIRGLISHHRDGEFQAHLVEYFGGGLVRGSGHIGTGAGAGSDIVRKGGPAAMRHMMRVLEENATMFQTADVPKRARKAGLGIVTLARNSGRPILPVVITTKRCIHLNTWDKASIHLPFNRGALVLGKPIFVPENLDRSDMEPYRQMVENGLNQAHARAEKMLAGGLSDRPRPFSLKAYKTTATLVEPLSTHLLEYRVRRGKETVARLGERKGFAAIPRPNGRLIWIHAASVGEAASILPLASRFLEADSTDHILLTTGTVTSARFVESRAAPGILHQFSPLDVPVYVQRFLDHWKPDLAIFVESELWPNMLTELNESGIPTVLVNGRLSAASAARWKRAPKTINHLLSSFAHCLVQTRKDGDRLTDLGAQNVIVSGNLKYDSPPPPTDPEKLMALKTALNGRPVWSAISTHPGEDELVADANDIAARRIPGLLCAIVPRHPERGEQIARILRERGLKVVRRSEGALPQADTDIYVADTLGEIGLFCTLTPLVYVGGSLVPHGGQNPIEPIKLGAAVIHGPHTHNFLEIYDALEASGAHGTVTDPIELASTVVQLIQSDAARDDMITRSKQVVNGLTGALDRTLGILAPHLPRKG